MQNSEGMNQALLQVLVEIFVRQIRFHHGSSQILHIDTKTQDYIYGSISIAQKLIGI